MFQALIVNNLEMPHLVDSHMSELTNLVLHFLNNESGNEYSERKNLSDLYNSKYLNA